MGLSMKATAQPSQRRVGAAKASRTASASSTAVSTALTMRIAYRPVAAWNSRLGQPTST